MLTEDHKYKRMLIVFLALMHRYGFPILIISLPYCFAKDSSTSLRMIGRNCLIYSFYTIIGYKLRWKHIYCSWQDWNRQKMTPGRVNWNKIEESDIYGISAIFGIFGIICLLVVGL